MYKKVTTVTLICKSSKYDTVNNDTKFKIQYTYIFVKLTLISIKNLMS